MFGSGIGTVLLGDKMNLTVRLGKLFYESSTGVQRLKKLLVRSLVKFATAVARLVCPDLLG